ncbi:hypothetical protein HanRHA438_Chr04g0166571 [Helianthus annuus]|nr:hypothetical protein HanHA300_Chr04g0128581 [Helianthus annuus]KAJ0596330.1 hypothetical protein HanHA89_Chr04g0141551 [Helianthus annuus]KAJ0760722.1 hypothetical protein HanOQP8_Chr04g0141261 [Helianthus annuus]KAJ0926046.1 hypothetical protein HanRHA438_Chr04g0166571 [Helianthus annuus]
MIKSFKQQNKKFYVYAATTIREKENFICFIGTSIPHRNHRLYTCAGSRCAYSFSCIFMFIICYKSIMESSLLQFSFLKFMIIQCVNLVNKTMIFQPI